MKNLKINAIFNVTKSCLALIFPLITYPYIVHVLGAVNVGKVSFVNSIVSYFILIAMLGVSSYAVREGSKIRDNKDLLNNFVSDIFTINVIFTAISCLMLCVLVICVPKLGEYKLLFVILGLNIVFTACGLDWINVIFEDYIYITIRSIVIYIINLVLIFIAVKQEGDVNQYAILLVFPVGVICVANIIRCRKYVDFHFLIKKSIFEHIRPMLVLFSNSLMITLYVNCDVTMLGWIKGDYEVGIYSLSVKVYTIIKNILVAIYIVALPRLSKYIGERKIADFKKLYTDLCCSISLLLIPIAFGTISISKEITFILGGEEYADSVNSLVILTIGLVFAVFGGLLTSCLNVPLGRENINLRATVIGAISNLALNFVCIPFCGQIGAAITTLLSELLVFLYCFVVLPSKEYYMNFNVLKRNILMSLIGSIGIVFWSIICRIVIGNTIIMVIITILLSILTYAALLFMMKNQYLLDSIDYLKRKIHK